MTQMTPRETIEAILTGRKIDRIPFSIYESKLPRCAVERELRNQGLCVIRRDVPIHVVHTPNVAVSRHTYQENGRQLTRVELETPVGTLHTITEPAGFTSWTHKRMFTKPEDYRPLLYYINDMQFEPCYEGFIAAQDADGGDCFFRGGMASEPMQSLISTYMGTEAFCMEWFDRRDEVLKLYEASVAKRRELYPICADSPAMAFNYGGNVTPEILGLDRFEEYYVPHYNEAADVLHAKGKLIGVHFDANCGVLAKAIADTRLDYIEAFTPAPDTDMTLAQAAEAWPDKVIWINYPSSVHLSDHETIAQTTRDLIEQAPKDRFIMGVTEDVPENRWQENMLTIAAVLAETTGR